MTVYRYATCPSCKHSGLDIYIFVDGQGECEDCGFRVGQTDEELEATIGVVRAEDILDDCEQ